MMLAVAVWALPAPVPAQSDLDRAVPEPADDDERLEDQASPRIEFEPVLETGTDLSSDRLYTVGAIAVTGLRAMQASAFVDIMELYSGRSLTGADLEELAARVAERARSHGFVFASAAIEPQTLDEGVLSVRVDEGQIDRIVLRGDAAPAVAQSLAPLRSGRPVTLDELERRLLLASDLGGIRVGRPRFERQGAEGVLIVEVSRDRVSGSAVLHNGGSQPLGPEQIRIDLDVHGVLAAADEVSLTYAGTPFRPRELNYGRLTYGVRLPGSGSRLALSGALSRTWPGGSLAGSDISGRSSSLSLQLSHPLYRKRVLSLWLEAELEVRNLRFTRADLPIRSERVAVLRTGLYATARSDRDAARARLMLSHGLADWDSSDAGEPLSSRPDAAARFTTLAGWADWTTTLSDRISVKVAAAGQLSTEPLLLLEEMGLGGTAFLRAYNYNERTGDHAIMGAAELRYSWDRDGEFLENAQLYAFTDVGAVDNFGSANESGTLASGGGGIRTALTPDLELDLEVAFPLAARRLDTGDRSPRLNFRVGQAF